MAGSPPTHRLVVTKKDGREVIFKHSIGCGWPNEREFDGATNVNVHMGTDRDLKPGSMRIVYETKDGEKFEVDPGEKGIYFDLWGPADF